jgi:hypothetical protein
MHYGENANSCLAGEPSAYYIQRGNNRSVTFFAEEDYQFYLDLLEYALNESMGSDTIEASINFSYRSSLTLLISIGLKRGIDFFTKKGDIRK